MKLPGGFELSSEILRDFPIFAYVLLIIIALLLVKVAFGKEIVWLIKRIGEYFSARDKTEKHDDWVAECVQREGWGQKGDAESIDLEGRYLKAFDFTLIPIGKPVNWRAGFILGNERFQPQAIVDKENAITIHVGNPPSIARAQYVWAYDWNYGRDNPYSITVKTLKDKRTYFKVTINSDNFLTVHINNQQIYSNRISPSYRKKVYLLAWGDEADCKIQFENIKVTI